MVNSYSVGAIKSDINTSIEKEYMSSMELLVNEFGQDMKKAIGILFCPISECYQRNSQIPDHISIITSKHVNELLKTLKNTGFGSDQLEERAQGIVTEIEKMEIEIEKMEIGDKEKKIKKIEGISYIISNIK